METKRYVLRLFLSLKHITANVVDRNNGRIVATASTVEHAIRDAFDWGRACNAKAAASIGEVLAMRLKTEGLADKVYINVEKEIEKKGLINGANVWAIVNALKKRGVKIIIDDNSNG
ncbi:hypothetical protein L6164_033706 [Bauhinia variegata]|uniref:Uncharacterized protein n=1 Tax=Bauhinia variegata TaxID=167791 RepID=A0ACB9KSQ4_BAUVA|nr:hypothetical protein L6164_033706 [Bauhinia variegata]